jgi:hypothetical protein
LCDENARIRILKTEPKTETEWGEEEISTYKLERTVTGKLSLKKEAGLRIQIQHFTLNRIRIQLLIVVRIRILNIIKVK